MPDPRRPVWRAARGTLAAAAIAGLGCLIGLSVAAGFAWQHQRQLFVPVVLVAFALVAAGYAWRFGLHPRIVAGADALQVRNPFRTYSLDWRDIAAIWAGVDGLVITTRDQRVEAWCVQKSSRALRAGRRARADQVGDRLWEHWLQHTPAESLIDGVVVRRARPDDAACFVELAPVAQSRFRPGGLIDSSIQLDRPWHTLLRDASTTTVLAVDGDIPVGYARHDGSTILELAIHPDARGRGIGSSLLSWLESELFDDPMLGEASLWVAEHASRARTFFVHRGWCLTPDRRLSDQTQRSELRMTKINPRAARRGRR